jgi:hypothetical protein
MMTLQEWCDKQPIGSRFYRDSRDFPTGKGWWDEQPDSRLASIPDSAALVDRPQAWSLDDWRVQTVIGGSIWFAKK